MPTLPLQPSSSDRVATAEMTIGITNAFTVRGKLDTGTKNTTPAPAIMGTITLGTKGTAPDPAENQLLINVIQLSGPHGYRAAGEAEMSD